MAPQQAGGVLARRLKPRKSLWAIMGSRMRQKCLRDACEMQNCSSQQPAAYPKGGGGSQPSLSFSANLRTREPANLRTGEPGRTATRASTGAASATQHNTGTGLWRAREIILDSAGLQQKGGAQCSEHTLGASQASQTGATWLPSPTTTTTTSSLEGKSTHLTHLTLSEGP
jgi:hypothetical protein